MLIFFYFHCFNIREFSHFLKAASLRESFNPMLSYISSLFSPFFPTFFSSLSFTFLFFRFSCPFPFFFSIFLFSLSLPSLPFLIPPFPFPFVDFLPSFVFPAGQLTLPPPPPSITPLHSTLKVIALVAEQTQSRRKG